MAHESEAEMMGDETRLDERLHKPTIRERLRYILLGAGLVDENPSYKHEVEKVITDEHPTVPPPQEIPIPEHQPDETVRMASEIYDRPMS